MMAASRLRAATMILLITMSAVPTAEAQGAQQAEAERSATAPANLTFAGAPSVRSVQFILDATTDKKVGTAAFGWRTGEKHMQLTLSGPLNSSTGEANPLSLVDLAPGATARFSLSRLHASTPNPLEVQQMRDLCVKHGLTISVTTTTPDNRKCRLGNIPPQDQPLFANLSHVNKPVWLLSGEGAVSHAKFGFRRAENLEASSEAHHSLSGLVRLGRYTSGFGFVIGSVTLTNGYEPASAPREICLPLAGTNAFECQTSPVGAPVNTKRAVGAIELRKFIRSNLGVTPSIQYDFREDATGKHVTAIQVPVYFIGNGTSALGGVRFGWRSDSKALTASVFIGASVGLLPN